MIKGDLRTFRSAEVSLRMAVLEVLNHFGECGLEVVETKLFGIRDGRSFQVAALRLHSNGLQIKDKERSTEGWIFASMNGGGEVRVCAEDIAEALLAEDIWEGRV